jgi:alkaline phosphatase
MPALAKKPKNIILMIGDGMGLSQITAGLYSNDNFLYLENFPIAGLHKCYSRSSLVTDSAAGATAFACGIKTYNGAIGVDTDTIPVPSILEAAIEKGMATGLVATSSIIHATPAAFYAHTSHRRNFEPIAEALTNANVDLIIGGGTKWFTQREDGRNLYDELVQKGYYVTDFYDQELSDVPIDFNRKFAYFTAYTEPLTVEQGREYLMPAVKLAPIFLNQRATDQGFFLVIESSQIDWGGHSNRGDYVISEMVEFNEAIGEVLAFAKEDGETLVIVTADHETGGLAINRGSTMDSLVMAFTTTDHTATMIPVFAYGPGASLFGGIYENTAIYDKMKYALGLTKPIVTQ